mmetsp:Transcript_42880/g.84568  ORF Transcript_42880/g.84568 Transcript_42880/m.84568 type:complete len:91 (+) Transcript_42880:209-481(+)
MVVGLVARTGRGSMTPTQRTEGGPAVQQYGRADTQRFADDVACACGRCTCRALLKLLVRPSVPERIHPPFTPARLSLSFWLTKPVGDRHV